MKYFVADTHFEHKKLLSWSSRQHPEHGKFETIAEHDQALIESINSRVGKRDQLYLLGDFGFNPGKYRMQIWCKHVTLIIGNHDRHQKSLNVFGDYHYIHGVKLLNGALCILCHYPMAFWPASHHGSYHLYGHVHGNREQTLDEMFPGRRSMDVSVDNLLAKFNTLGPISEEEVIRCLSDQEGHDQISFYKNLRGEQ